MQKAVTTDASNVVKPASGLAFPVLLGLSLAHLLNDMMQSLVPAIYPVIKGVYNLDFSQIGFITFTFRLGAIFQKFHLLLGFRQWWFRVFLCLLWCFRRTL